MENTWRDALLSNFIGDAVFLSAEHKQNSKDLSNAV